jgi:hypothetical protein
MNDDDVAADRNRAKEPPRAEPDVDGRPWHPNDCR